MSQARSLADINIAAGVALPVVSKIARRAVIILALTLLVTTAAFARGYTRLDHRLEQSDRQHRIVLASITKTNEKQHRVVVAKTVKVNKERERLATEVSYLRSASMRRPWRPPSRSRLSASRRTPLRRRHAPVPASNPAATFVEEAPPAPPVEEPPAQQPPVQEQLLPVASPRVPPPAPTPPPGPTPGAAPTPRPAQDPPAPDPAPDPAPELPVAGLGAVSPRGGLAAPRAAGRPLLN